MNALYRSTLLLGFLALPAFAGEAVLRAEIDAYIEDALIAWEAPGLAIAVVKDGETILARGYGQRELGTEDTVNGDTLFAIGSTSKAFTALALGLLVDEDKLDWDDRVVDRLPGFQLHDPYATREMRVRDLLCHRSGLERGDMLWYGTNRSREDILRQVRHLEPSWSFRSTWGYQNIMFLAAGQIIPAVTGQSWDDFVADRIFRPLGMANTHTSTLSLRHVENVATPHEKIDGIVMAIPHRNIDNVAPAGSIYSSVTQMAEWIKLHLARGLHEGNRIASEDIVNEMQTPQMQMRYEGRFALYSPEARFLSYGLAWFLSDYRGRFSVHHGGAIDGMRAHVAMLPEENIGVVSLCNMDGSLLPVAATYWIYDRLLDLPETDWSASLREEFQGMLAEGEAAVEKRESERLANTSPTFDLKAYTGEFNHPVYEGMSISVSNGALRAEASAGYGGDLTHWHHDTFQVTWDEATRGTALLVFGLNAASKVSSLNLDGLGTFERVDKSESDAS